MTWARAFLATLTLATLPVSVQAVDKAVPAAIPVDRQENGYSWRYYFHEVPSTAFRFRSLSQAEWHFVWSAIDRARPGPLAIRYECKLDEEGRYVAQPACRADCPGDEARRACREVGQRYFDRAADRYADMPEDHDPERARRRYVAFDITLAPASRPLIDFDEGTQAPLSQLVSNYKGVMRHAANMTPRRFREDGDEASLTAQCKVLADRSIACRKVAALPAAFAGMFDGVAEQFALTARPVRRLPDGRDPVGMTFTQTVRFEIEE